MVERVEHLRPEIELESFAQLERLGYAEVHIPIARRVEDVAASAVRPGIGNLERAGVSEDDGPGASSFLQFPFDGLDDIGARDVREVRRSDAASNAERLAGHTRVDAVERPTANHRVHKTVSGVQPFAFADR